MKTLVIVKSIHHQNTEKIAKVFADVLDSEIISPRQVDPNELQYCHLVGFGSGIYSDKHQKTILNLVDNLPQVTKKNAFIFSTSAMMGKDKVTKDLSMFREKLQNKGYIIVDEFACKGYNTNSFLKYIGGMNKSKPNADDFNRAEQFDLNLKHNYIKQEDSE